MSMAETQSSGAVATPDAVADREHKPQEPTKMEKYEKIDLSLRAIAVAATLAAAIVTATNKQTKHVEALVNNIPVGVTLTAKYHYARALVFFVVMNAIAGGYALLSLVCFGVSSFVSKTKRSDLHKALSATLDLIIGGGLISAASAASAVADLGRTGNKHTKWMKICNNFSTFCDHVAGALITSFVAVAIFIILNVLAALSLYRSSHAAGARACVSSL